MTIKTGSIIAFVIGFLIAFLVLGSKKRKKQLAHK
jgi:hypothetical protein